MIPRSGDVLWLDRETSVQFVRPRAFRVIRVHDWSTYHGWIWLDGYELNAAGDAVERRSIFVQISGLKKVADPTPRSARKPANARPPRTRGTNHLKPAKTQGDHNEAHVHPQDRPVR